MDLKTQVGQCLVAGFPGKELSEEFIRLVKEYKVGNVILFQHNVESMEQVKRLCREIRQLIREETGEEPFITIDQEGGVVTRLPGDGCNIPGAMAVAASGKPENARMLAKITAKELKSLGVNFNLAPVMDINNNPLNPVIGVRSYGDCAETVIRYGTESVKGYEEENLIACAKHFPGHGDTAVDSHLGLPVIDKSLEELEQLELRPFREVIAQGIPAVMSSHILFPKLEPDQVPCTMSKRMITGLLKEKIGFQGLVISDCMEMDAIQKYYGTANGMVAALKAGIDLIIVSHSSASMEEGILSIYRAVEQGEITQDEISQKVEKICKFKNKYISKNLETEGCSQEDRKQERQIRKESITLTQGEMKSLGSNPFFTGCAGYRATNVSNAEQLPVTFAGYMAAKLGGNYLVTSKNPETEELEKVKEAAKDATSIIIGTYNAHLQPGQKKLIALFAEDERPTFVVALRDPYDLSGLPEKITGIAAWDNSLTTLEILEEMWKGQFAPTGTMPIKL